MVATDDRRTQTRSAGGEPEEGATAAAANVNVNVMLAENCGTSAYLLRFRVETPRPGPRQSREQVMRNMKMALSNQEADRAWPAFLSDRQRAEVSLSLPKDSGLTAKAEISSGGLLSIAVLVSSILLSTAVLIHIATRDAASRRLW